MGKFLTAFLEMKNEDELTRKAGLSAFLVIMLSLALLSVCGAIASSSGDWAIWIIRIVFALLIAGAEVLDSIIFVRAVNAGSKKKAAVCFAIWVGLSWTCVQNAKEGVHFIFPDRFEKSATEIAGEADVVHGDAQAVLDAKASTPKELERVRTEIADKDAFLIKMAAMTPEGIKEAQSEMIGRCGYTGRVDGERNKLTESAMRVCGERINRELTNLRQRENNLLSGQGPGLAAPVGAVVVDPRMQEVALKAKADKAWWDAFKLEVMLWVLEVAKSMGLWAAFTNTTAKDLSRGRARQDELDEARHMADLAAIRAGMVVAPAAAVAEAPPPPPPEPAPAAIPEPVEQPVAPVAPDTQHMRNMALASAQARAGRKAQAEQFIAVPSLVARDQALKVAAE